MAEKYTGTITSQVDTTCLCGRKVSAGYDEDGTPCVIHEAPSCEAFERIECPVDFLEYLNKARSPS